MDNETVYFSKRMPTSRQPMEQSDACINSAESRQRKTKSNVVLA